MITKEMIEKEIVLKEFCRFGKRSTICLLQFKNGFECIGVAITQDPANFDGEIGAKWAYEDAIDKAFPAFVFIQDEARYRGWPEEIENRFQ